MEDTYNEAKVEEISEAEPTMSIQGGCITNQAFFFFAGDQPRIILQKIREKNLYTFSSDGPCETKNGPHTFFKQQNELLSDKLVAFEIQVESFVCVISNTRDHAMFQRFKTDPPDHREQSVGGRDDAQCWERGIALV